MSGRTYRELAFPYFREVFIAIDSVCNQLNIDYYLIGAQARDLHLLEKGIKPNRGTQDIDFAVMLPEMKLYDELFMRLIAAGFRKVTEPYRLIFEKTNTVVDILPYGEVEEEGTIKFTGRETELTATGLKEVAEKSVFADFGELSIKVSPPEGLVILKLISYSERPDRKKDLDDLNDIISNYYDLNEDRLHEELVDVLEDFPPYTYIYLSGARLLGRDMKKILLKSEKLNQLIYDIIKKELQNEGGTISDYFLHKGYHHDHGIIKTIFEQMLKGLTE